MSTDRAPGNLPRALTGELFDLGAAVDVIGQASAARLGIHKTDLICLNLLYRNGPMNAGEIATALGLTTAAISAMATRLEADGYAHREMDPKDRRRVLLHPSETGTQQAFRLFDQLHHAVADLFSQYPERDQKLLVDLLREFTRLIGEQTATIRAARSDG